MFRSFIYNCSAAAVMAVSMLLPSPASAVTFTTELVNTTGSYKSLLYKPQSNPNAHVGVFVMHSFSAYSGFAGCSALATRGFTMLCADTVFTNRQSSYKGYEDHAAAITAGIQYLRNQPGITKVLIFGHSMGAPMMSFYDWVQENGIRACQDRARLIPCDPANLVDDTGASKLLPVDGVILFDAHLGDALATYTYMDPAIKDPDEPGFRDDDVDMFDRRNGYPGDDAAGSPTFKSANYNKHFKEKFFKAQAKRNADVLQDALRTYHKIEDGDRGFYEDMPFAVPGSDGAARLFQADLSLVKCTKRSHIFLGRDGSTGNSPGPICSVRIPSASFAGADSFESYLNVSIRVWLGAHALRTEGRYEQTEDDIKGIDFGSTNTSSVLHARGITKPVLIVANGAHYFLRPDEMIFDALRTNDKTFAITEGAVHGGGPCSACEQARGLPAGYFGDTQKRTYDFMAAWLQARY
jgi:hypothetical protein